MSAQTSLLIIGAGPFGLGMAAYARHHGIDYLVVGQPMSFWQANMPSGMLLRSGVDWHLCPQNTHTIERYLNALKLRAADVEPLSRNFYLGYTQWYREQKRIEAVPSLVRRLDSITGPRPRFRATLQDGETIKADRVVLAVGFGYFAHVPPELAALVPPRRLSHTCNLVEFDALRGKRCLIVGGRQSAFEWTALLHEHGADAVYVVHRHPTPTFAQSDWSWVPELVERMVEDPGWFRRLPRKEREQLGHRFWAEGRLKLEPWLQDRIDDAAIHVLPNSQVSAVRESNGKLDVELSSGMALTVDHIIAATGYKVDLGNVPFLRAGNLLARLQTAEGFPVLDEHFQTSVPGLFVTSMPATRDFGPFFAFTVAVCASARVIGSWIADGGA